MFKETCLEYMSVLRMIKLSIILTPLCFIYNVSKMTSFDDHNNMVYMHALQMDRLSQILQLYQQY